MADLAALQDRLAGGSGGRTASNTPDVACMVTGESGSSSGIRQDRAEPGERKQHTVTNDTTTRQSRLPTPQWSRLGERTRTMLRWLNATMLLREADLVNLVWPEPVSRQAHEEALARWQQRRYIQPLPEAGERCYQLDRVGARVLRSAGFSQIAPAKPLMPRARPGILLANRVGAGLLSGARSEPRVKGFSWMVRPFSGTAARADGIAALCYATTAPVSSTTHSAPWIPELISDRAALPPGQAMQRLVIEIDSGTESQRQLNQRARGWRDHWDAQLPSPAIETIFLWITTGSIQRLNRIWEAWIGHAFLPAFFTTYADLAADGAHWQPWEPLRYEQGRYRWLWRDLYGRPRSLKPWEMNEPRWRSEALQPVTRPSLAASIAEWDRRCPAPGY